MQESDLELVSFPNKAALPHMIHQHKMVNEADQKLLDGLTRAGFKLDGEGTGGVFFKYWRFGGVGIRLKCLVSFLTTPLSKLSSVYSRLL